MCHWLPRSRSGAHSQSQPIGWRFRNLPSNHLAPSKLSPRPSISARSTTRASPSYRWYASCKLNRESATKTPGSGGFPNFKCRCSLTMKYREKKNCGLRPERARLTLYLPCTQPPVHGFFTVTESVSLWIYSSYTMFQPFLDPRPNYPH